MEYYVYMMGEKVEMMVFDDLKKAHRYCQNPPHFSYMYIIWEGDIKKSFDGYHGVPLAMYVNGKRYDVSEHDG